VPGASLAAVYSRDQGRAEAFAQKHGAAAAYSDLDALLRDPSVDAVFVSSPNALHAEQTIAAAQAGKHVLVEKPMATRREDAVAMIEACRAAGVTLGVGFHLRQHPGHKEARRLVESGALGAIAVAQGQWGFGTRGQDQPPLRTGLRQWWGEPELIGGASAMMGTGVHVVDLLRFVLGQEVVEVAAITDGQSEAQPLENLVTLLLRFDGGTLATVTSGRRIPDSRNDLALYGSNGRLIVAESLWEGRQGRLEISTESDNRTAPYAGDALANYLDQFIDFEAAVEEKREPAASGIDGLRVIEVTLAMIESARSKRVVAIEPLAMPGR
jgi:1,5-anhydro-D-fructose reductase (1,5-anhydro-D-mannitol-forming)